MGGVVFVTRVVGRSVVVVVGVVGVVVVGGVVVGMGVGVGGIGVCVAKDRGPDGVAVAIPDGVLVANSASPPDEAPAAFSGRGVTVAKTDPSLPPDGVFVAKLLS